MKFILRTVIIALFTVSSFAQQNSTPSNTYHDPIGESLSNSSFRIGTGVLLPQKKLKKYFGISPFVELSFDFPTKNGKSIEFALQMVVPNQKEKFKYARSTDTISAKASFMINPMVKFRKDLFNIDRSRLNIGLGIGASLITTDARNPFYEGETGSENKKEKYETISTMLIAPSIEYTYTFRNNDRISMGFNLQFSPYKVEGSLQTDIGSLFYVPRIAYKF
ncbi:MAG: hypothetical protein V3U80_06385 [Flavobacteriaceae bacterium]